MPAIARENEDGSIEEITFEELKEESGFTGGLLELIEEDKAGSGSCSLPRMDCRYIWAPTEEELYSDVRQAIKEDEEMLSELEEATQDLNDVADEIEDHLQ